MRMPQATLLGREQFSFGLQPIGFVPVFRTALFEPKLAGPGRDVFVGNQMIVVGIEGRRREKG